MSFPVFSGLFANLMAAAAAAPDEIPTYKRYNTKISFCDRKSISGFKKDYHVNKTLKDNKFLGPFEVI